MEEMDEDLQVKCARVKNVTLPAKEDENENEKEVIRDFWERTAAFVDQIAELP
jgi:hypothetical protein